MSPIHLSTGLFVNLVNNTSYFIGNLALTYDLSHFQVKKESTGFWNLRNTSALRDVVEDTSKEQEEGILCIEGHSGSSPNTLKNIIHQVTNTISSLNTSDTASRSALFSRSGNPYNTNVSNIREAITNVSKTPQPFEYSQDELLAQQDYDTSRQTLLEGNYFQNHITNYGAKATGANIKATLNSNDYVQKSLLDQYKRGYRDT